MTSAFSWQNSVSLCPASFCSPRPNLPVTPGISSLPTFVFQSPIVKRTSPDGQYWKQTSYILHSQRWRSSIQSVKTRPGADCGSNHELLIAKFRFKLKKVGKTTRPFRYDLNQIPYDYTAEVRNRFKGLDLIECLMNYGMRFVTLYRRQGSRPSSRKRNARKQNGNKEFMIWATVSSWSCFC